MNTEDFINTAKLLIANVRVYGRYSKPDNNAQKPARDMAYKMGHACKDLPAMVRDMSNRFWICLIFTVPIYVSNGELL